MNQLTETWLINNRINLYLLNSISEESYKDVSTSKGRTVGEQFAHIHNVRLMWLNAAMPQISGSLEKIEKTNINLTLITEHLTKSADAIGQLIEKGLAEGKIKNFKPHPQAFVGYIIAHEAHHRGQIVLSLKQSGHSLDKKILYGLCEWGSR